MSKPQLPGLVVDDSKTTPCSPVLMEIPVDRARMPQQLFQPSDFRFALSAHVIDQLTLFSQCNQVTLFDTFAAALHILLFRYTRQEELLVWRKSGGQYHMTPAWVSGDCSFVDLAIQMQNTKSVTMHDFSFAQVILALQEDSHEQSSVAYEWMLTLENSAGQWLGTLSYNAELFEKETIERMAGHFINLLQSLAVSPAKLVAEIPLLTVEERQQLLIEWNRTQAVFPDDRCVQELFEAQARRTPHAQALLFEKETMTYAELNQRANQLAHHLRKRGVRADKFVGICVERSLEMIICMLGVLKAGGAYVPLDPTYPSERLAYMLEDVQVEVLLTQQHVLAGLPVADADRVVCVDTEWSMMEQESSDNPELINKADDLAYVIFTSGSTGRPKGTMLQHRGLCNMLAEAVSVFEVGADTRFLQFASFSFDVSVKEIFTALVGGATLCMAKKETLMPGSTFVAFLRDKKINTMILTPAVLAMLSPEQLPDLRIVITGGEAVSAELAARWATHVRFFNAYGPTESTVWVTYAECASGSQRPPLGRAIRNTELYVLDERMEPVPIGVAGELYIGSVGLARGYLNRPDLTAEKFVRHPFNKQSNARLYKSGDLVRYRTDGQLEFLGRVDDQVKIRGFRIELGEIEEVLLTHEAVEDVLVIAREDATGEKRLVAYVVVRDAATLAAEELRSFLHVRLPDFMMPAAFVMLERFPLTPNGKVDRRALPLPAWESAAYVAPRTALEKTLVGIWGEVLGSQQLGIEDHFLELGGHSLSAIQILARVREQLQIEVSLKLLFAHPTIAKFAAKMEQDRLDGKLVRVGTIRKRERTGDAPMSMSQERVWFIHKINDEHLSYNAQAIFHCKGKMRVDVLERCLTELVRRHEIYRTTFHEVNGQPVQRIHPPFPVHVPIIRLTDVPVSEQKAEVQKRVHQEIQRYFDMGQLPLFHFALYKLNETEHVLLHMEQHMIHDGWSYNVFLRELLELYSAYLAGRPSPLAEPALQFADYTEWQQEWLRGEEAEKQRTYWKQQLKDCPPMLEMSTDFPRPAVPSYRGRSFRLGLPVELTEELNRLSREQGVTLFVTMLSAFYAFLHRYTGQDDLLVGSGVANRRLKETENLIGMIVNNITLRARLSPQMTFRELIDHVGTMTLDAYANEDLPFDRVVEAVNPERHLGIHPLYQVMFSFHDSAMPELNLPDLEIESKLALNSGTAKFDLNIVSIPHPVPQRSESNAEEWIGLTLIWDFSTDLWEEATASRMLEHYLTLLKAMVRNPDQVVTVAPMLSEAEHQRLLSEWNESGAEKELDGAVHDWFEKQAVQTPNHPAVLFGEESLSYRELNERANRLAHYLRANGVNTGDRVGLFLERSAELIVCVVAVLKAGGTYVPLDPAYPQERLSLMLEDTQVAVVLSVQGLAERLPEPVEARVVCLNLEGERIVREPAQNLALVVSRDQAAYVIFTSGSTGRPKGVPVPHRGIVRLVKRARFVALTEDETMLQFAPITFDASVFEVWSALLNGGRLVVFPPHLPTLQELGAFLIEHKVTTLFLTAGLFHQMVEERIDDLRHVRQLLSGGDVLSVTHVKKVLERRPDITLVNCYGPTENAVMTTVQVMNDVAQVGNSVLIGRPIAGTQVYVLDRNLQPVPQGVPGELCTSGEGLADGYLHRPELTAEKFVPHPFAPEKGKLLYRTGDLVRWRSDGNLEFLGRVDNQVKIRGFRIELGEIETQLRLHPEVREVSVIAREDMIGDKRLVAYLVLEPDSTVTPQKLRRALKTTMPDYMIPSAFVTLDALPLTHNGKVDTRALPQPERAAEGADKYAAPNTVIEQQLALLWQELFGRSRIGLHDHFFHLGGSSLLALKLLSRLRKMFEVEIPLQTLFERPVLLDLAAEIETLQSGAGVAAKCAAMQQRTDRYAPCPLSFDQEELWQLEQEVPGNAVYNANLVIHLNGELQVEVLERSMQEIVRRHDALRTRFEVQAGEPMMVVMPELELPLSVTDLHVQHLSREKREAKTKRCAVEFATQPFDLKKGPLIRILLLRKTNLEHTLLVTMHHIITDGWSLDVFLRELSLLYTAFLQGEASPLPELPIQFADYVLWQRETMKGERLERLLSFWKKKMSGAPKALALPTDRPRPKIRTYRGSKEPLAIPRVLADQVKELAQREGVTMFMTMLATFNVLLSSYAKQEEIVLGTPMVNRHRIETEDLIGYLLSILLMRTDLSGDPEFQELLQRESATVREAFAHKDMPVQLLMDELATSANQREPLYQVMFVYYDLQPEQPIRFPGLTVRRELVNNGTSEFELMLVLGERDGEVNGRFDYNTDLFDRTTIVRFGEQLINILQAVVANPKIRVSELAEKIR